MTVLLAVAWAFVVAGVVRAILRANRAPRPPLSEADVRLRLYPSSGRVVKVTEGYWPSRLFGDDIRGGAVVYELPLPPEPRVWTDDAGQTWARCDDGQVLPVASRPGWVTAVIPARTRPEGEPDGNR